MKYRIETVSIPVHSDVAQPGSVNDASEDLDGRRILHVLEKHEHQNRPGDIRLVVLTEEAD